jgi:pyruvate dehydrogenase E2 component (dihydrolipoamide acetyltransferase)
MEIRLPRLGEGADSGTVASIFVKVGDQVRKDQPLLELESEKAVASIPAPLAGTVTAIHVRDGDAIKVGQLIVSLADDSAAVQSAAAPRVIDATVGDEEPESPPVLRGPAVPPAPVEDPPLPTGDAPLTGPMPAASPSIRRIARDLGIDLRRVKGSEHGGRVVMEDLRRYVQRLQQTAFTPKPHASAGTPSVKHQPATVDFTKWGPVQVKKMTTLRKTISQKMVEAWTTIPHVTQFDEADVTAVLALRKKYVDAYTQRGTRLTLTSFALKAVVATLQKHPIFNASVDDAAGEIVYKDYYHIGIAVDTEHGLIVPVIRDADKKHMVQLSIDLNDLALRTRDRKVSLEEMQGGTFSISNQGGIGSGHFTPIINKPEVAILGIGQGVTRVISRKAVVTGNGVDHRTMLPLSLSYDHRVIDGADAARFMVDLVQAFEQFNEDLLKVM